MGTGKQKTVVAFCMPEVGHVQRLLPVIAALSKAGARVHAFLDRRFAAAATANGAVFHDLFRARPLSLADADSQPMPCRYVSFAGRFTESLLAETRRLQPDLVLHDSFAVVAVALANKLKLPRVNICSGHNLAPEPTLAALAKDPRVNPSAACLEAATRLRDDYGIDGASPLSYITSQSTELNIICEPPEFLTEAEAAVFAPVTFFGSLPDSCLSAPRPARPRENQLRIYASLGTVIWRYYADYAREVLYALTAAVKRRGDCRLLISLGGNTPDAGFGALSGGPVLVRRYVDQWAMLGKSDLFLTHHGLNSTHEAIFQRVPMLSCPFFSDQPALAHRCQAFGVALPLSREPRAAVSENTFLGAIDRFQEAREQLHRQLERARGWELRVMERRPQTIASVLALA